MAKDVPARVRLGVLDGLSQTLDSVRDKFPQITRAVGRTNTAFELIDKSTSKFKKSLSKVGDGITTVGKGFTAGFTLPVIAASAFAVHKFEAIEDALVDIKGSANLTSDEIAVFGDRIGKASKSVAVPTETLLKLAGVAGDIGVRGVDNLEKFTISMAQLEKITGVSAADSADDVFKLLQLTGDGVQTIDRFGSALAATGDKYGVSAKKVLDSTTAIGREISKFKVSSAQVIGLAAAVEPLGFNSKQAAGAVGDAFRAIDVSIREGGQKLKGLEAITGMTGAELKKQFGEDATVVFRKFLDGVNKIKNNGGETAKALAFFGASGEKTQIILEGLAKDTGKLGEIMGFAGEEFANNTALTEKYAEATATFSAKFQIFQNKVGVLETKLGAFLIPYLEKFMDVLGGIIDFLDENPAFAKFVGVLAAVLAVVGPLLLALGYFVGVILPGLVTAFGAVNAVMAGFAVVMGGVNLALSPFTIALVLAGVAIFGVIAAAIYFRKEIREGIGVALDWASDKLQMFIEKAGLAVSALKEFFGFGGTPAVTANANLVTQGVSPQGAPVGGTAGETSVNPEFSERTNNARVDINVRAPQSTSIVGESQGGFMSINRGLVGAF